MPVYDYRCDLTQQVVEVTHKISETMNTWGELCSCAKIEPGDTPLETPVKRIMTGVNINVIKILPKFDASILPK